MDNRVKKYLRFDLVGPSTTGKTRIWQLTDLKYGAACGFVKWYGGFRKYVFEPFDSSYWDSDALEMIAAFLREQNRQHRYAA
jgi:hypothetical protein